MLFPQTFRKRIEAIERWFYIAELVLAAIGLIGIVINLSIIIITRFIGVSAIDWTPALANVCLIWLAWLGTAAGTQARTHLIIDIVSPRLSTLKGRRIHGYIVGVIMIFYACFLIYNGIPYAIQGLARHYGMMPVVAKFWVFIAIPIGSALLIFHSIINLLLDRFQVEESPDGGDV